MAARSHRDAVWIIAALGTGAGLAALTVAVLGRGERGTDAALAATARLAFLFFLGAYAGGPLATLFGRRFHALRAAGRNLGLAFAAVMAVHALLIVWLCHIGAAPSAGVFAVFGPGLAATAGLAAISFGTLHRMGHGIPWWLLRRVGMNIIAADFALDFLHNPLSLSPKHIALYLPFAAASLAAPALYTAALIASVARRRPATRAHA